MIHLAANTNVSEAFLHPFELYHDNILGALNIMEYCRKKGVKKIIYSGSYVYGVPKYLPVDEKHPVGMHNPYGRSKLLSESLVSAYSEDYNIDAVILRSFNIYGAGQNRRFLIPLIMEQLLSAGETIKINDLSPKRDFVYIKDVIEAIWKCCKNNKLKGVNIFNVGSGRSYSVEEVLDMMFKVSGKRKKVAVLDVIRKNEMPDSVANIDKIKEELGWEPKFTLETGLIDMFKNTGTGAQ